MWTRPVYDRTWQDVSEKTRKGFINTEDLNRIENNIRYLADLFGLTLITKAWSDNEWIYVADVRRIGTNIGRLVTAYAKRATSPDVPEMPYNDYTKWNDIEKILGDIKELYDDNMASRPRCGEIYSGELFI